MTTNKDTEYLRICLKHTTKQHGEYPKGSPFIKRLWWGEEETVSEVARILIENCTLDTPESAMSFYDKPYNFEKEMQEFVDKSLKSQETAISRERESIKKHQVDNLT